MWDWEKVPCARTLGRVRAVLTSGRNPRVLLPPEVICSRVQCRLSRSRELPSGPVNRVAMSLAGSQSSSLASPPTVPGHPKSSREPYCVSCVSVPHIPHHHSAGVIGLIPALNAAASSSFLAQVSHQLEVLLQLRPHVSCHLLQRKECEDDRPAPCPVSGWVC